MRVDGRKSRELRPVRITSNFVRHCEGSALIELGATRVLCTAMVEDKVPDFLRATTQGWLTAEYGMLPGSGNTRIARESARGRVGGRTHEIQRLIGRSLRAVTNLKLLGPRTIWIDCDVIEADGGTRTAAITGAYVALALAVRRLQAAGTLAENPLTGSVAAVSAGIVGGQSILDLCYEEDSRAEVDMNFVTTGKGKFVEVQGTAESKPFSKKQLDRLAELAIAGIAELTALQHEALRTAE